MNLLRYFHLVFIMLFSTVLIGQTPFMVEKSDLVIEGIVQSKQSLWNADKSYIITQNNILVKSVFKGHIEKHIITVNTVGGQTEDVFHFSPHSIELSPNEKGVFFLKRSEKNDYQMSDEHNGFFKENDNLNPKIFAFGKKYTKANFEKEIINVTRQPKIKVDKEKAISDHHFFESEAPCSSILQANKQVETIEFQFENAKYTDNFTYLEFDVTAKVNVAGLKFGKGELFIRYTEEFGTKVIENETVEITKGAILENNIYGLSYEDHSPQTIKIIASSNEEATSGFYTFGSESESLFHVRVAIADFSDIGDISFDDIDISGQVYLWCDGEYILFGNVKLGHKVVITPEDAIAIGITYSFENALTNANETDFSVDIYAQATEDSYYSDGFIIVNYNELGLENFTFEMDGFLPSNVYQPFLSEIDVNTLRILIFGGDNPPQSSLSLLSTTPQRLGTLTFSIKDCDENKELSFDEAEMQSAGTIHHNGMTPIPWEAYNPIVAEDEDNGEICCELPIITSFETPHPNNVVHAGMEEILIINGENFGAWNELENTVIFRNGDNMADDEMEAGSKDFEWDNNVNWTDTEIKVKVPSTDKNEGTNNPAASGRFKVKNKCGISEESDEALEIPYGILNVRSGIGSTPFKLTLKQTEPDIEGGLCFNFSNELPAWIRTEFEFALEDWCSKTGINFLIGETINKNGLALDNINLISFESTSGNGLGGGMSIQGSYFNTPCVTGGEPGFPFKEIDFVIVSGVTSPTQANQDAMREIIKHELGHAHMLCHSRSNTFASQYLMHPNGNIGGVITAKDSEGANLVFSHSSNIVASNCGQPIQSGRCSDVCVTTSIDEIAFEQAIEIYPNPTSGLVKVQLSQKFEHIQVTIRDLHGKELKTLSIDNKPDSFDISLPETEGVYFLIIEDERNVLTKRIIKI